jgi:hypothetical protein
LATTEKLGTAEAYYVCPTERLSMIITDKEAENAEFDIYRNLGISLA